MRSTTRGKMRRKFHCRGMVWLQCPDRAVPEVVKQGMAATSHNRVNKNTQRGHRTHKSLSAQMSSCTSAHARQLRNKMQYASRKRARKETKDTLDSGAS